MMHMKKVNQFVVKSTIAIAALLLVSCGGDAFTFEDVKAEFIECKASAKEKHSCKSYPTKSIAAVYKIDEFKDGEGNFIAYDEVLDAIDASGYWGLLGDANDQAVLDEAQALANEGIAVVAIHGKKKTLALIISGNQEPSSSWGNLNCPNSACLFMNNPDGSYIDKKLSYAWKSPKKIKIYARD
jgi:hypothetical protein